MRNPDEKDIFSWKNCENASKIIRTYTVNAGKEEKIFSELEKKIYSTFPATRRSENKQAAVRSVLHIFLFNLYLHCYHGNKLLHYSRNKGRYTRIKHAASPQSFTYLNVRYVADQLINLIYIIQSEYCRPTNTAKGHESCIYPTPKLFKLFEEMGIDKYDFFAVISRKLKKVVPIEVRALGEKNVIIKPASLSKKSQAIYYERLSFVTKYNDFIKNNNVRISFKKSFLKTLGKKDLYNLGLNYLFYNSEPPCIHCVFNGENMLGGRFYSFFQNLKKEIRLNILINGNPTVEIDFQALHIHLLYREIGSFFKGDPYENQSYDRKTTKIGLMMMINSKDEEIAIKSMIDNRDYKRLFKTKKEAEEFISLMFSIHSKINKHFNSGVGLRLQFEDSVIAMIIMKKLTEQDIICLCVHDSFIVEEKHQKSLEEAMRKAIDIPFKVSDVKCNRYSCNYQC